MTSPIHSTASYHEVHAAESDSTRGNTTIARPRAGSADLAHGPQPSSEESPASPSIVSSSVVVVSCIHVQSGWAEAADVGGAASTLMDPLVTPTTSPANSGTSGSDDSGPGSPAAELSHTAAAMAPDGAAGVEPKLAWGSVFDSHSKAYLWMCYISLLIGWVFNNIGWMYVTMYFGGTYAFFQDQSTAVLYLLMLSPVIVYRVFYSRTITPEMRATVDWKVYAIMGLLDALYNLLTAISSPFVSGPVQNLIFQLPVPIVMVCVKVLWPRTTRYLLGQYVGATIIIGGATLSVLPQLVHPVDADDAGLADNRWTALLTYVVGVVFYSFGTIYKAHTLKHAPTIDYWYVTFVENVWAFVLGFAFLPLLWLPGVSQAESPSTSWPNFQAGWTCFFHGVSTLDPSAHCSGLWWISTLWIASNIWVNVLGLVVCRLGDSVVFNVINSVQLPLTNLCLASSFIMTAALVSPFSPLMWVAVACVFVGFAIYQFVPLEKGPSPRIVEEEVPVGTEGEEGPGEGEAELEEANRMRPVAAAR